MTTVYFDSSAFVKLLIEEEGTDLAVDLWDGASAIVSSVLAYPEVRAALAAAHRNVRISAEQHTETEGAWEQYWASVRTIPMSDLITRLAGQECVTHALSGADGVHLASMLAAADADIIIATWDKRLSTAASASGFRVAP